MKLVDLPVGDPGAGEVRIRHHASGLNYIDVYQRSGVYTLPMPLTMGNEGAGVIEAVGAGVTHLKEGDRAAYCSGPPGSYSLARVMPAKTVVKLPDAISFETGAAMMLKGLTTQYLLKRVRAPGSARAGRLHRLARRRRRRRPDRLPVGEGARPEADRHGRQRGEMRARARQRRRLHDQLPHRGLRRARQGDHRRQGRQGRLRLDRQGHLGQVARVPAAVRPDGELRQRLGRRAAVRAGLARAEGLALRDAADARDAHRDARGDAGDGRRAVRGRRRRPGEDPHRPALRRSPTPSRRTATSRRARRSARAS